MYSSNLAGHPATKNTIKPMFGDAICLFICILFLSNNNKRVLTPFRLCVVAMVMFGAIAKIDIVWNLADASMGLMALVNLVALLLLSNLAIKVIKDYQQQKKAGKIPTFIAKDFPELDGKIEKGIWE